MVTLSSALSTDVIISKKAPALKIKNTKQTNGLPSAQCPQGADPLLSTSSKAGRNHLNEEITPPSSPG